MITFFVGFTFSGKLPAKAMTDMHIKSAIVIILFIIAFFTIYKIKKLEEK